MKNNVYKNKVHIAHVLLCGIIFSVLLFTCFALVSLLRMMCHVSTILLFAATLLGLNIYACKLMRNRRCTITDDSLIIDEIFVFRKSVSMEIPICLIDSCVLKGCYPFYSIELMVHGRTYTISNFVEAKEVVSLINDKISK